MKKMNKPLLAVLAVVLSFACLPLQGFAIGTQDRYAPFEDYLLIHYDFEGNDLATQLSDKAGGVQTNLNVTDFEAVALGKDGGVTNAVALDSGSSVLSRVCIEDGIARANDNYAVLTTGVTDDTKAIYNSAEGTIYLRAKVEYTGWQILLSYRNTSEDRPLALSIDGSNGFELASGGSGKKAAPALPADGWVELAIKRKINTATYTDEYEFWFCNNGTWEHIAALDQACARIYSVDEVVLSLFTKVQGGVQPAGTVARSQQYDDIRFYCKSLSTAELNEVHSEVTGAPLPAGEDRLLIHYDFEGEDLAAQLSDKAGDTKTDLSVIGFENVALDTNGNVTNAATDPTVLEKLVIENGVARATANQAFALTTGITEDTKAIYNSTEGTVYLRAKVNYNAWQVLLSYRDTTSGSSRPWALSIDGANGFELACGTAAKKSALPLPADGWVDIAITRTTSGGTDAYRFWFFANGTWTHIEALDQSFAHSYSPNAVVLSLFAKVQGGAQSNNQTMQYDDLRYYDTVLTVDELSQIHAQLVGSVAAIPTGEETAVVGAQRSLNDAESGSYSLRLLAQIKKGCTEAGFYVQPIGYKEQKIAVSTAYTSVLAEATDGTQQAVKAFDGSYLTALTVANIPLSKDEISFAVTPYTVKNGVETKGITVTFYLKNGKIQSATKPVQPEEPVVEGSLDIYPTLYEVYLNRTLTQAERQDQALCEALIARMGGSAAVCVDKTTVLWNGLIQKLDNSDYSAAASLSGGDDVTVPADFANRYFGAGSAAGAVSLKALAQQKGYTYYYDAANKLAIVSPAEVASFEGNTYSGGYTNLQYRNRMAQFFSNPAMPEPSNGTEQSRVVIEDAVNYFPEDAEHYEVPVYTSYYSPAILTVRENGANVLYQANERSVIRNGNELTTVTVVRKSLDGGEAWQEVAQLPLLRWATLMEINGVIYGVGSRAQMGLYIFRLESDGSTTVKRLWTTNERNGESGVHEALIENGILYLPLDEMVASVPIDQDIMNPANWTKTQRVSSIVTQSRFESATGVTLSGGYELARCQEGNMVSMGGKLYAIYRIESMPYGNYAVMLELSADRTTLQSPKVISLPTTVSRFTIKYDEATGYYICISNLWTVTDSEGDTCRARNVLGLSVSTDLVNWTVADTLLVDRAMMNSAASCWAHAYQYVDWDFDGDDLVMVVREATGFTNTFHDGKYLTFYRVENYAALLPQA